MYAYVRRGRNVIPKLQFINEINKPAFLWRTATPPSAGNDSATASICKVSFSHSICVAYTFKIGPSPFHSDSISHYVYSALAGVFPAHVLFPLSRCLFFNHEYGCPRDVVTFLSLYQLRSTVISFSTSSHEALLLAMESMSEPTPVSCSLP